MNFKIAFASLAILSMAILAVPTHAEDVTLELEYDTNALTWTLYGEVTDVGNGVDGSNGISAIRALIDNIDFGTQGDAVTIASGIGALDPVQTSGGPRPPVLQTAGGTLDILFGQDLSETIQPVVGGVGVGSRSQIADGTFPAAGTPPAFGDDDNALTSDALFLNTFPGPFGNALDPDNIVLVETDITSGGGIDGDYDDSGQVGQTDLDLVLLNWGAAVPPTPTNPVPWVNQIPTDGQVNQNDLDGVLLNWGNTLAAGAVSAVPEPSSMALLGLALVFGVSGRRRK